MSKIIETIVEPNKIEVGSTFKLKVRVIDIYIKKQIIISEDKKIITTEAEEKIRTEWGEENE